MKVKSESEDTQLCPTLSDPMDCSLPGSSVHGIFQARVLEWVAIAFSDKGLYKFLIQLGMRLLFDPETLLLGIHSTKMKTCVHRNTQHRMFMAAFIHNSHRLEAAQVSINKRMNKQIVVYL